MTESPRNTRVARSRPSRAVTCPTCGSGSATPIAYGLPGHELWSAAERGEVLLGGCMHAEDSPTHRCDSCGHEWLEPRTTDSEEEQA